MPAPRSIDSGPGFPESGRSEKRTPCPSPRRWNAAPSGYAAPGSFRSSEPPTPRPVTPSPYGWHDLIAAVKAKAPNALVGLGTVRTEADAERALARGADFLVSPHPVAAARATAHAQDVLFVEGGTTPAEIGEATDRGVAKVFPAHLGGPPYLKSLLSILPGARIIPRREGAKAPPDAV
ncbi:hypothetical protein DEO23_00270 [Brachybacterium endophyticum]|uniref:Uncharacterized protein n=1 Tax=Brachybacterium endophyticum TaxID=2182385 RepID=A0A2U2RMN7_9MICO|nr:hypothetical protein [Brachybacterium endophyticum]PWH07140.1 hypothetical protein DEO23_00270 [Brachybacterium endophyticum]